MLNRLYIKNFRCFEELFIPSLGRINLIVGKNSVGKTSLLEAIYFFASGGDRTVAQKILKERHEFLDSEESELFFGYRFSDIAEKKDSLIISDGTPNPKDEVKNFIQISHSKTQWDKTFKNTPVNSSFVSTVVTAENDLAKLWDNMILNSEEHIIKDILTIISHDLVNIFFIQSPQSSERIAIVKISGQTRGMSLKSMGEGMSRLLQIFLHAFQARGGYLLIDEFENGLHFSIQEDVWNKLFKLSVALDIQIFATTHSQDAVKAFSNVVLANQEEKGSLIALGRSIFPEEKKRIVSIVYDDKELAVISKMGMEVR